MRKIRKIHRYLLEADRQSDIQNGGPVCIGCGWSRDDPELDLCCDCADAAFMSQMLRGEYGREEQREARQSRDARLS